MTSAVERAISAVRTIRASGAEEREGKAVDGYAQQAYHAGMRIARLQAMINPITSTTIQVAFLVVLGLGGARVASGAIQVGDMVAFVLFLFMLWFPLGRALTAYSRLQSGLGALQRIEEMVDLPQETDAVAGPLTVRERTRPGTEPADAEPRPPAIEFEGVSFGYGDGETVLRDVSLAVPAAPAPRSSAPPERASPPSCRWWNGSTTSPPAPSGSAAPTYATCPAANCADASATSSSRRRSSPAPSATTSPSPRPTPPTTTCGRCCARSTSWA